MLKKIGAWLKLFGRSLKQSLPVTAVMAVLWLALGWARSFGIHSAILFPLNFLTGALAGLDGGSVIGGTIGKTLLLLMVNSFIRTLITKRGGKGVRLKEAGKSFLTAASRMLPQYNNIKQLFTGQHWRVALNGIGFGMAFVGYAVLTGNGSLQNSFLCVLLFAQTGGALVKQRGLIITLANRFLRLLKLNTVDRDLVNRLVGGNALGNAAAVAWAAVFDHSGIVGWLGGVLALACTVYLIVRAHSARKKEVAAA